MDKESFLDSFRGMKKRKTSYAEELRKIRSKLRKKREECKSFQEALEAVRGLEAELDEDPGKSRPAYFFLHSSDEESAEASRKNIGLTAECVCSDVVPLIIRYRETTCASPEGDKRGLIYRWTGKVYTLCPDEGLIFQSEIIRPDRFLQILR